MVRAAFGLCYRSVIVMAKSVVATSTLRRAADLGRAGFHGLKLRGSTNEVVRDNARLHLVQRLGRLRGLPQKMGQILSMSEDDETADAFAPLTDSAEPVPLEALLPVMAEQWNREPETVFGDIDAHGLAASLGQVHRATLRDGRVVAIKVQYPGIREAVEADLKMLGWLSEPVGGLSRGFDLADYRRAIRDSLNEELDYVREAEHQRAYADASGELNVTVPQVIDELSGARVLTTVWEDGQTIREVKDWPAETRKALGRQMLKHFLFMLFDGGLLHADPHSGNYRFRAGDGEPQIVLYDYGCVRAVPEQERLTLLRLIHDTYHTTDADPYPFFVKLGFDPATLEPLRHKLPALCRVLFDPFSSPMKFDLQFWRRSERIGDILGDDRWNFRISGPARLIFILRAFHGLVYYLRELQEPVSWTQFLRPLIAKHADAMKRLELPVPADPRSSFACLAKHLCIKVTDSGTVKAKVTLPAEAIDELQNIIDPQVQEKIESRGITLDALVRKARVSQYAPQPVFSLDDGPKRYEVWLE